MSRKTTLFRRWKVVNAPDSIPTTHIGERIKPILHAEKAVTFEVESVGSPIWSPTLASYNDDNTIGGSLPPGRQFTIHQQGQYITCNTDQTSWIAEPDYSVFTSEWRVRDAFVGAQYARAGEILSISGGPEEFFFGSNEPSNPASWVRHVTDPAQYQSAGPGTLRGRFSVDGNLVNYTLEVQFDTTLLKNVLVCNIVLGKPGESTPLQSGSWEAIDCPDGNC